MASSRIKTYSTKTFRDRFMEPGEKLDTLLPFDFKKFFIVRVEEMIRLIKFPVPPTIAITHTFIYLTSGEAIMNIGSETYKIFKDECLVVPAGQIFSFANLDINQGYLCNFGDDFIIGKFGKSDLLKDFEFLSVWGNPRMSLDKQTSADVLCLLERLFREYSANGLKNMNILQSYLIALLCEIGSVYKPLAGNKRTASVTITNQFKAQLFANIKTKHRVTDYASLLNITPNHLNKSVKAITGKSPTKWIDEILVLEAKVLLYQTDLSISEVASEMGVFDQSYFSRLFKKYEGVTPMEFRKMIEKS